MDDRDIFVTLEANIIDAVKKLVQNARLEFNAQKGKIAASPSPNNGSASASMRVSLPAKTVAKPQPAGGETVVAAPKKVEEVSKEPASMMDAFATVIPPSEEQTPSDSPPLVQSNSTEGGEAATAADVDTDASAAPAPEPVALSPEEEAKKQLEDLAADVDGDLHLMAHMRKPAMARRKTHQGTASRFDPNAPALPEPAVVALVPEPVEPERPLTRATSASMAGPRQPMVNLADLQKRGGGRGGGPGRGGMAGRPVDSLPSSIADHNSPMRRQTAADSTRPRPAPEIHRAPPPLETQKSVEAPHTPSQPAQPPPPEPAKLPDEVAASTDAEAPPLPSLPVSTPLSPLRTPNVETGEPDLLSLDTGSVRRNSGANAPLLPSDPVPSGSKSPAGPKPPGGHRSPLPGPAPPPSHSPAHHVPGPAPPARVLSPGPRKVSSSGLPPHAPMSPTFSPLEVQVDGEIPPPIPVSTPSGEGETEATEPEKKVSMVMNHARAKQPMINLADLTKPRTPKVMDSGKASPAAAGPAVPKCVECGCNKFVMNPFKKGTNCSTCFHQHPAA